MADLRVGVIGAGLIAQEQHLPYWRGLPEAEIVAVSDVALDVARRVGEAFGASLCAADYRRVLEDERVNVVDICLPSALHAEVTCAALRHGKHVLCEKPMATSRAAAAEVLNAAREAGRKLMIVQNMRYFPSALELKRNVDQLGLGHVYYARGQWLRRRRLPGRPGFTTKSLSGGGPLYDLGVHIIDLVWWLMGARAPLRRAAACSTCWRGAADSAANGAHGTRP